MCCENGPMKDMRRFMHDLKKNTFEQGGTIRFYVRRCLIQLSPTRDICV